MFKKIFLMVMIVLVLVGMMMVTFWFFERQAMHQRQYQLLCEELVFGMSEDEVLNVLQEKGTFKKRYYEFSSDVSSYDIWFVDLKSKQLFGEFVIVFNQGKYYRAARPIGATDYNTEFICTSDD